MKIVKLEAENIKRLVAVEIEPDGSLVQISGRNGAGKSSVLDSIWWALAGERSHQSAPIRAGETQARIRLDLGEVVVTREFRLTRQSPDEPAMREPVTTRLRVETTADGARFPNPQTMLDSLLGSLTFDPLAFSRASDREQVEALSGLCGVDMAAVEAAHKADYEARAGHNRRAKQARAQAEGITVPAGTPDEPVSLSALAREMRDAEAANREREAERRRREREAERIAEARGRAENLDTNGRHVTADVNRQVAELERQLEDVRARGSAKVASMQADARAAREQAGKLEIELAALPPVEPDTDTSVLQERIGEAEERNRHVAARQLKRQRQEDADLAERCAQELTARMQERREQTRAAIAAAELPVDGLSIRAGRVHLGELPLEVASDAERLRVSCAIAMRGDAKLRVLRVRDGSLLDPDSLELLRQMAEEADYQVWVEMVDTSGQVGVVIEDGRVAS